MGITYFCVVCQEKHPVEDIGVDIWGILGQEISENFRDWLKTNPGGGENLPFWNMVKKRWNVGSDEAEVDEDVSSDKEDGYRLAFALTAARAEKELINRRRVGNVLSGVYRKTYRDMLMLIPKCTKDFFMQGRMNAPLSKEEYYDIVESLPAHVADVPVIEQLVNVYLTDTGAVDHITDENNDPFIRGEKGSKTRRGFLRICAHCGTSLSRATGMAEETVVAMTGSARAGKTSCIIALIASLLAGKSKLFELVEDVKDPTWVPIKRDVDAYNQCNGVGKTQISGDFTKCISLLLKGKGDDFRRVLTLIDMPGEFWMTEVGMSQEFFMQYSRIFTNLDAIWLLISKATITLAHRAQSGTVDHDTAVKLARDTAEEIEVIKETRAETLGENLGVLKETLVAENRGMPPVLVIMTKPDYLINEAVCNEDNVNYALYPDLSQFQSEESKADMGTYIESQNRYDMSMILRDYTIDDYNGAAGGLNDYSLDALAFASYSKSVRAFVRDKYPEFVYQIENGCRNPDQTSSVSYITMSPYGRPAYKVETEEKKQAEEGGANPSQQGSAAVAPEDVFAFADMALAAELAKVMHLQNEQSVESSEASRRDPNARPQPYHEQYPLLWTMAITNGLSVMQNTKYLTPSLFGGYKSSAEHSERRYFDYRAWRRSAKSNQPEGKGGLSRLFRQNDAEKDAFLLESGIAQNLLFGEEEVVNEVTFTHKRS